MNVVPMQQSIRVMQTQLKDVKAFFKMNKIVYYHLNDNNGEKDQHLTLGEGNFDLNLLNSVDKGIIELNNYQNILKSRDLLISSKIG